MTPITSPGVLLRAHDYSESSRILRFLTPELGVVAVIAKGVRRRSARGEEPIRSFGEGILTFGYRPDRDLHTLRDYESGDRSPILLGYPRLAAASLVAELVLVHSMEGGNSQLYDWVLETFHRLANASDRAIAGHLLAGAWRTLALLGFPPELAYCVRCGSAIEDEPEGEGKLSRLDIAAGGLVCPRCSTDSAMPRVGPEARRDLLLLIRGSVPETLRAMGSHLSILEAFSYQHLAPARGLRTFEPVRSLLVPREQDAPLER